ncbi:MAG: BatA domain-containing protein [Chthoniobacteraceae bacterium]
MNFLAPWMLYGLAAIAAPIAIHLWRRRQIQAIPFGSLRFLKAIASRTRRSSRLENLLLLFLRCLLFALIVAAAARPVMLARSAQLFGGEVPRTVILVIDHSASMGARAGGQTRLEAAKACALSVFDDLKQGDRVAVIAASDRAGLLVAEPTIDRDVARKAVAGIRLTETRGDFAPALREAGKITAKAERGLRQVFLFTDSQETGWRPTLAHPEAVFDLPWKQETPQLIVVRPDDLAPRNACIKELRLLSPFLVGGSTFRGVATVENLSNAPLHDLVQITIGNERAGQRPVDAAPGATVEVPFEFEAPGVEGSWARGTARLSGDDLPADDAYYFSIPVYRPPRVTLAEGTQLGPERLRPSFFLRKALEAGGAIRVRTLSAAALDDTGIEGQSAVFLADPGRLSDRAIARLERFLESGGTVALFPGDQTRPADAPAFLPARPTTPRDLPPGRQPVRIADSAHPLFADAWDNGTPFPALPQKRLFDWKLTPRAAVLMTLGADEGAEGGAPFLIQGERGPGRVLIVNASADRTWGDFPLSPAFLPLVQQIARYSATQPGRATRLSVGDPLTLPPNLPRNKPLALALPGGEARTRPADAAADSRTVLLERADASGFYSASAGEETAIFPVNVDRAESDLKAAPPEALEKAAGPLALTQLTGRDALAQWLQKSKGLVPFWPFLLGAALAVFILEAVLANLAARRRAQGEAITIATGRLTRRRAL